MSPCDICRRKIYDETGSLQDSEDLAGSEFDELYKFYRGMYRTVDENEIDTFTADFRGSEEEKRELLKYYDQFHGDMDKVWWALCCLIQGTSEVLTWEGFSHPVIHGPDRPSDAVPKSVFRAHSLFRGFP
jgi:hypothetical protein